MALVLLIVFQDILKKSKSQQGLIYFFSFLSLVLATFILYQPWDELFISLRHSLHFSENGSFSFNQKERVEGIVDFLPFFFLGVLSKLGLPLLETHFFIGIIGTWLCVLAGRRTLINLKVPFAESWSYPALLLYPPLILNTANGFTVPLFTALLIYGWNFLFLESRTKLGWIILAIIPLLRLEGIWFSILVFIAFWFSNHKRKNSIHLGLIFVSVLLPTLGLTFWRHGYFGHFLPVPVLYKSAFGYLFYFLLGLRNWLMDFLAGGGLLWCWIVFNSKSPTKPLLLKTLALFLLFCIPYYLSGGDWFPPAWQRYLFPFSFFLYLSALCLFGDFVSSSQIQAVYKLIPILLLSCSLFFFTWGSYNRLSENLFSHKTALSGMRQKRLGKNNYRLNYLSRLGNHLNHTTPPDSIIGSSELATIMFFAKRDALDLLGVTNLEIAKSPIRPAPNFFSKVTNRNELPYLIFKRLKPDLLFEKRPHIFYAFDFILTDLLEEFDWKEVTHSDLKKAITRWDRRFELLNLSLFGGINRLREENYSPVLVRYGEDFYSLYFVSSEFKEAHFKMMEQEGMKQSVLYE